MYVVPSPSAIRVGQTEPQLLTLIRCSTAVIVLLSLDALKAWRATLCLSLHVSAYSDCCLVLPLLCNLCEIPANVLPIDDENFPALPSRRPAAPPGLSRVASVQNSIDLGTRSSTPKLPPGLNISHAHPSPSEKNHMPIEQESAKAAAANSGPIIPAVPLLPVGQHTVALKPKSADTDEKKQPTLQDPSTEVSVGGKTEAPASPAGISLGSPKPRRGQQKTVGKAEHVGQADPMSGSVNKQDEVAEIKQTVETKVIKSKSPGKIVIPQAKTGSKSDSAPSEAATGVTGEIVQTPSIINSQPSTPATPPRATARPLVVRLVTATTKAAETTPASATTEKSAGPVPPSFDRQHSRRPSVSSISHTRSSTPAMSDAFSFGASRASSPPPGIVGSAPERAKTKAQQRKDRKEKAKQTVESEQVSGATTPVVEEVAPVISRQRKQKKRVETSTESGFPTQVGEETDKSAVVGKKKEPSPAPAKLRGSDTETKAPAKPKRQDSVKSSTPSTPREESKPSPLIHEPPKPKWTLRDLYNYTAKHPDADIQTLLNTHVSSTAEILASLLKNNDIDMASPLINPPPLSSYRLPQDSRRGADYLDANGYTDSNPFGMLYLTQDKKRAIQNGHAVRISDASKPNDLLRRAMISPTGTVWRHLNEAEEERVLELEERKIVYAEEYGAMGLGIMDKLTVLEEDDYMNLEGGMDRLSRNGEAHGVSWVMRDDEEDDENVDGENEDELEYDDEDEDLTDDEDLGLNVPGGWETGLALGTVPENVHITNKANVLPPMRLAPDEKRNLRGLDIERLIEKIKEAQREVESARKEVEKCEKLVGKKSKEALRWREATLKKA